MLSGRKIDTPKVCTLPSKSKVSNTHEQAPFDSIQIYGHRTHHDKVGQKFTGASTLGDGEKVSNLDQTVASFAEPRHTESTADTYSYRNIGGFHRMRSMTLCSYWIVRRLAPLVMVKTRQIVWICTK
jgi:hypothetical protein